MSDRSTFSPERFDALRAENPDLIINLYAMTPRGVVTLEVITPDGETYSWTAETAAEVYVLAFPETGMPTSTEASVIATDIFD